MRTKVDPSEVKSGLTYMVQEEEGQEWYECAAEPLDPEIGEPMLIHWIRTKVGGNDVKTGAVRSSRRRAVPPRNNAIASSSSVNDSASAPS